MLGFNNNINLCNRFATSIYLCYSTVYVSLWKRKHCETNCILDINDEADLVNKDDKNDSDSSDDDDDDV